MASLMIVTMSESKRNETIMKSLKYNGYININESSNEMKMTIMASNI